MKSAVQFILLIDGRTRKTKQAASLAIELKRTTNN
jgi:hypothetical protein